MEVDHHLCRASDRCLGCGGFLPWPTVVRIEQALAEIANPA